MIAVLAFSTHQNSKKKKKVMDGLKMVRHFLALALAMSVASQPLDTVATSGAATLSTQFFNWAQVGFEAFLVWARQGYGEEKNSTTASECTFF